MRTVNTVIANIERIIRFLNKKQENAGYSNTNRHRQYVIDDKTVWTSPKVLKIIRDQMYASDMISNVRARTKIAKQESDMMSTMVELIQNHIKLLFNTEELIRDLKQKIYKENKTEMTVADADNVMNKMQKEKMNQYERNR